MSKLEKPTTLLVTGGTATLQTLHQTNTLIIIYQYHIGPILMLSTDVSALRHIKLHKVNVLPGYVHHCIITEQAGVCCIGIKHTKYCSVLHHNSVLQHNTLCLACSLLHLNTRRQRKGNCEAQGKLIKNLY